VAGYSVIALSKSLNSTAIIPIMSGNWLILVPTLIGILMFARFTKYTWLSRYAIATLAGLGLGVSLGPTIQTQVIDCITMTARFQVGGRTDYIWGPFIFVSFMLVAVYYLYSIAFSSSIHTGKLKPVLKLGRLLMYFVFGNMFGWIIVQDGFTILSRIAVEQFRNPYIAFMLFLEEAGAGVAIPILVAGIGIPAAGVAIHFLYTDVLRGKRKSELN